MITSRSFLDKGITKESKTKMFKCSPLPKGELTIFNERKYIGPRHGGRGADFLIFYYKGSEPDRRRPGNKVNYENKKN
jgi:hypothetical protein